MLERVNPLQHFLVTSFGALLGMTGSMGARLSP